MRIEFTSLAGGLAALLAAIPLLANALSATWPALSVDLDLGPSSSALIGLGLTWAMRDSFDRAFRHD